MGLTRDVRASRGLTAFGTLLVTATFAACEVSSSGLDLPEQLIDGITYRVTGFVIAESFPVQIGITVELENESTTPQSVTFPDGCVVLMRAYGVRDGAGMGHGPDRGLYPRPHRGRSRTRPERGVHHGTRERVLHSRRQPAQRRVPDHSVPAAWANRGARSGSGGSSRSLAGGLMRKDMTN